MTTNLPPLQTLRLYSQPKRTWILTSTEKGLPLYTITRHNRQSLFSSSQHDLVLTRGPSTTSSPQVGTVIIHSGWSGGNLDLSLSASHAKTLILAPSGLRHEKYAFFVNGRNYMWKPTHTNTSFWSSGNYKLVEDNAEGDRLIARFESHSYKSVTKVGVLEIYAGGSMSGDEKLGQEWVDLVVTSACAVVEKGVRRRTNNAAASNAGAGGGSAGCGGGGGGC